MTPRRYVTNACRFIGIDLYEPTKADPNISIIDYRYGVSTLIVEAKTWVQARNLLEEAITKDQK